MLCISCTSASTASSLSSAQTHGISYVRHNSKSLCSDELYCLAQIEPKVAPKSAKKAEPLYESASDSEEESADMEDDSSSESPEVGTQTAAKSTKASRKSASRTPRTVRASSKRAAKAITAACADLEENSSRMNDSPEASDSEAATDPNESLPSAVATVEQKKDSKLSSQKKKHMPSKSPSHHTDAEIDGVRRQGCISSSPEGSSRKNLEEELKTKSAEKIANLRASSDDVSNHSESEAESEAEKKEAESPIPVLLKSRKLQKGDVITVQSNTKTGRSFPFFECALQW